MTWNVYIFTQPILVTIVFPSYSLSKARAAATAVGANGWRFSAMNCEAASDSGTFALLHFVNAITLGSDL